MTDLAEREQATDDRQRPSAPDSTDRPNAPQINARAIEDGREELERGNRQLAFSGVTAGLLMGLSGLGVAILGAGGDTPQVVAALLYPLGFIAVILGRAQLFTENTLYPVAATLADRRVSMLGATLRLWAVVLAANIVGTILFALLAGRTGALDPSIERELIALGERAVAGEFWDTFFSAIVGGWLVALAAWLVLSADTALGRVVLVFLVTYVVGAGEFAHSIATSAEILTAVVENTAMVGDYAAWFAAAVLGNIVGGVVIVTFLNYGQVSPDGPGRARRRGS